MANDTVPAAQAEPADAPEAEPKKVKVRTGCVDFDKLHDEALAADAAEAKSKPKKEN